MPSQIVPKCLRQKWGVDDFLREASLMKTTCTTRSERRGYSSSDAGKMAYHIMEALPDAFTKLVLADSFSGGMLVQLGGKDHDEPTDDSIKASCTLLTPMVTSFPYKVPSQFLVADALLLVNLCLSDKLLKVPVAHAVTPRSMACQNGAVANFELFRIAPADELCDKSNI